MRWRAAGAAAAGSALLGLSGCGGSSSSSPTGGPSAAAWASSVCGAIQTWVGAVSRQPASLESPGPAADARQIKSDLSAYLQSATDATTAMLASVKNAGAPATDRGGEVDGDLITALQPIQQAFAAAKMKIDALPITDAAAFQSQAQEVANSINAASDTAKKSFDGLQQKYKGSELERAFDNAPACNALKGS